MSKKPLVPRTFMLLACLTVTVFVNLFSPTSANAQASSFTQSYSFPLDRTTFSGCAGGALSLEGQTHFLFHDTQTPSGQRVFRYHTNLQGAVAVDASGREYRVSSGTNEIMILEESGLRTFTVVQYWHLLGQGSAPNERFRTVNHVTINNNGEITSIFSRSEADCDR